MAIAIALGVLAPTAHAAVTDPSSPPFTGSGGSTGPAMAAFEAAVGGADNGTTPGERGGGFRHATWDAVAVDGSDPGSTVIPGGHTVAVSPSRMQPWGIKLGPQVAVSNNGFASDNSHAGFPAFSSPNEWAPFNSNTTELDVVAPAGQASTPRPAVTRGLGVVFLNVKNAGTTVQYYSRHGLLDQESAPQGATSFVGVLFRDPVVTRVVITLGTATLFDFGGSGPVGTDPNTLAAADDVVLAEPGAGQQTVTATAGVPISPALASFNSSDAAGQITATIDWGDGARSNGTVAPGSPGAFTVGGNHSYALPGTYTANVAADDFGGSELVTQALIQVAPRPTATGLACSPSSVAVSAATKCTATVSDLAGPSAGTPTGLVTFTSPTPGVAFAQNAGCLLGPTLLPGVSSCVVQFTPGTLPPNQARLAAVYGGDDADGPSGASTTVAVHPQRCTLRVLTRRLRPAGEGVLVTCDARSGVKIVVEAQVARKGRFRAFRLQFGALGASVTAGRPTVLVIKPAAGVVPVLRAALRHHQRVSLKMTLTASSNATSRTTTTRVPAIRIS